MITLASFHSSFLFSILHAGPLRDFTQHGEKLHLIWGPYDFIIFQTTRLKTGAQYSKALKILLNEAHMSQV